MALLISTDLLASNWLKILINWFWSSTLWNKSRPLIKGIPDGWMDGCISIFWMSYSYHYLGVEVWAMNKTCAPLTCVFTQNESLTGQLASAFARMTNCWRDIMLQAHRLKLGPCDVHFREDQSTFGIQVLASVLRKDRQLKSLLPARILCKGHKMWTYMRPRL